MAQQKKPMKGVFQKNGYWYARVDNREVYCGKGSKGLKTAEMRRMKYEVECHENREIKAGLKIKKIKFNTISDMIDWYMELPSVKEKKSYGRREQQAAHVKKFFGNMTVDNVDVDLQEDYREYRRCQGNMDSTIDNELSLFRTIYRKAMKRKKISADHVPGEFILKNEVNPRRVITDEEFKLILVNTHENFADLWLAGYESAMRADELATLTPSQVHFGKVHDLTGAMLDYIDLGIFDTKTGARRTVPISAKFKDVLRRRMVGLGQEDMIFTNNEKKWYAGTSANYLKRACNKACITYGDKAVNLKGERIGIVFHCLRHTRTSKWVEMGYSDEIIRRATGHKTLEAYHRYIKIHPAVVMRLVSDENTTIPRQNRRQSA